MAIVISVLITEANASATGVSVTTENLLFAQFDWISGKYYISLHLPGMYTILIWYCEECIA